MKPKKIVDWAVRNSIKNIAITDHDTIKGSLLAKHYVESKNLDINIIIGAEYKTDCGDLIALFIDEEIKEKESLKFISKVHEKGGIVILPHPFHAHQLNNQIINKVDIIEIFNSRLTISQNEKAKKLAKQFNKPTIVGNDAHVYSELPLCLNFIEPELGIRKSIFKIKRWRSERTKTKHIYISQLIKGLKRRNFKVIKKQLSNLLIINLSKIKKSIIG